MNANNSRALTNAADLDWEDMDALSVGDDEVIGEALVARMNTYAEDCDFFYNDLEGVRPSRNLY